MRTFTRTILFCLSVFLFSAISSTIHAQSNAGSISGVVTDPSGAVIPGATVVIQNPVSQYKNRNHGQRRPLRVPEYSV